MLSILASYMGVYPLFLFKEFFCSLSMLFYIYILLIGKGYHWDGLSGVSMLFGLSNLSYLMIFLSIWVVILSLMAMKSIFFESGLSAFFCFMFMVMVLSMVFSSINLFSFYIFFECTLVPVFFLILGWGYKIQRVQAGYYLMMYTIMGSLPLLFLIVYHYMSFYSTFFDYMLFYQHFILMFFILFGFLIKMPMFFVHLWLPKAHVEAPVSGSMILAGVLLKLGGYGMLKFMKGISLVVSKFGMMFICISLMGGVISSFICIRQTDMKSLIAYSSISHMSLVISGILSQNLWGLYFSVYMMVAHGLSSSGLFYLVNVIYERSGSRSIYMNKGLMNLLPNMSMWWFLFICCNMASPPSLNLLSEIGLINSIMTWSLWSMIFLALLSFLSACYSLYLFSFTQHGSLYKMMGCLHTCYSLEFLVLFLHLIPLNFMFLFMEIGI